MGIIPVQPLFFYRCAVPRDCRPFDLSGYRSGLHAGYVLSEPFPVLCFCSGISGHGVPSVLYSACQGKMAGMDRRGIFHLDDHSGFSSVIRRNIHQLPGKCFCGGNFDSEFCDFLCFNEKLRTIFSKAAEAQKRIQKQMKARPQNHYSAQPDGRVPKHRCAVCGRTELDHPELEFRYCSKCNGNYEYCQDHLFTHEHVK